MISGIYKTLNLENTNETIQKLKDKYKDKIPDLILKYLTVIIKVTKNEIYYTEMLNQLKLREEMLKTKIIDSFKDENKI